MPNFAGGWLSDMQLTEMCPHCWMNGTVYWGRNGQLKNSNRKGKGWSYQSPVVWGNQSRWLCLNKNVMLTWWRRWQVVSPASGIWQPLLNGQSQCIIRVTWDCRSHTTVSRDTSLQRFQTCSTALLCTSSRKRLCLQVSADLFMLPFQGHWAACWSMWLWCLWTEPYVEFGLNIWWSLKHMSYLFQIYFEDSRPFQTRSFDNFFWLTEDWLS